MHDDDTINLSEGEAQHIANCADELLAVVQGVSPAVPGVLRGRRETRRATMEWLVGELRRSVDDFARIHMMPEPDRTDEDGLGRYTDADDARALGRLHRDMEEA